VTRPFALRISLVVLVAFSCASRSFAQQTDDGALKLAEPDFTLIGLPTRCACRNSGARFASRIASRARSAAVTSAISQPICSASIRRADRPGVPLRHHPNGQIGVHRTSDRTTEFFASTA